MRRVTAAVPALLAASLVAACGSGGATSTASRCGDLSISHGVVAGADSTQRLELEVRTQGGALMSDLLELELLDTSGRPVLRVNEAPDSKGRISVALTSQLASQPGLVGAVRRAPSVRVTPPHGVACTAPVRHTG
jgi:hypothetical protein